MHTLIVTFTIDGIDEAVFRERASTGAARFAGIPGLRAKIWLADEERGVHGGVYLFETAEAADAYLASAFYRGAVTGNPHYAGVTVRRADVLDAATAHTSGGLLMPATSAA